MDLDGPGPRNHMLDRGRDPHTRMGNFDGKRGPAQDSHGHFQRLIYSKQVSRGQNWYGADADGDADWRHLMDTIEPSVCLGEAALCQITLTTCHLSR